MSRHTFEPGEFVDFTSMDGIDQTGVSIAVTPPFMTSESFEGDVVGVSRDRVSVEWTATADDKTGFDIITGSRDWTQEDRELAALRAARRICTLANDLTLGMPMRHKDPFPRSPAALRKKYAKTVTPITE